MPFRQALAAIIAGLDLPFGYTLTVWSSGAIASHYFGPPQLEEILTFIAGAIGAYLALALLTRRRLKLVTPLRTYRALLVNVSALLAAAVVIVALHLVTIPALGFLAAGFVGTLVYALALALALWFHAHTTAADPVAAPEDAAPSS